MVKSRLVKLEKVGRKNRYGKCDWWVTLEIDGDWIDKQYWARYTEEFLFGQLRSTCNCTIPKEFA